MTPVEEALAFFDGGDPVEYLWLRTSAELVYFHRVLRQVLAHPVARRFQWYVRNREPIPRVGEDVIVIQIGNEDHRLPELTDELFLLFTSYPPSPESMPENVRAIPLGYNGDVPDLPMTPFASRRLDAFFSGQATNYRPAIGRAVEELLRRPGLERLRTFINYTERFRAGLAPDEYASLLMDAKVVFAPMGTRSPVTFRFFEAARAGNVIVSCELPRTWYYDPFPGIIVEDWDALPELLDPLFRDPGRLEELHHRTVEYYRNCCSEDVVARYILGEILSRAGRTGGVVGGAASGAGHAHGVIE